MEAIRRTLQERSWRVPGGERHLADGEKHTVLDRLNALFAEFADPKTTSCAARGLIQGVVAKVGDVDGIGNKSMKDDETGRTLREMIVTFLTDIGTQNPRHRFENDPEVRSAARRTLAQHVCTIVARSDHRSYDSYTDSAGEHVARILPENFGTLSCLVNFYEEDENFGSHGRGLDGKHLQNVQECLGRVYRELRRQLDGGFLENDPTSHKVNDEAHVLLQRLNHLFVRRCWWDVLSVVRAVSAIPALYEAASKVSPDRCPEAQKEIKVPCRFDWDHLERFRCDGTLTHRLVEHRQLIEHDLWSIQAMAGGKFDPKEHHELTLLVSNLGALKNDLGGIRPLLLDLVSTFVREVWFAHIRAGK